jgi:hypothetical protein
VTRPGDPTGREYWAFSANTYVKNAVRNVKIRRRQRLPFQALPIDRRQTQVMNVILMVHCAIHN